MQMIGTPTHQYAMAVVVPVKADQGQRLRRRLRSINEETIAKMQGRPTPTAIPFHEMESVHYARLVLIDESEQHDDPAFLVLSTNYDGAIGASQRNEERARAAHIDELVNKAYKGFDKVFACCEGYEGGSPPETLVAFLAHSERQVPPETFYVGSSGRSRQQIFDEINLREKIEEAADRVTKRQKDDATPDDVRDQIVAELKKMKVTIPPPFPAQPDGKKKIKRDGLWLLILLIVALAAVAVALAAVGVTLTKAIVAPPIVLVALLIILYLILRFHEWKDVPDFPRHDRETREHTEEASIGENLFMQNQLTHLVDIKDGRFRSFVIKVVFAALHYLATYLFNNGRLGNIPSIHFARWMFLGKKRRVLFFSNFDNSWQSYLGDFVDQASTGLTAVWSNTKGYPKTKNLLRAGSRNATSFLAWTRAHQLPTDVWYSAYPALSVRNLNANTLLRRGLTDHEGVSEMDWLYTLAGEDITPLGKNDKLDKLTEPVELPVHDIQGIILKGYGFLKHAAFVMLKVEEPAAARKWLAKLPITPGKEASRKFYRSGGGTREETIFVNVAFSYTGLEALGLDRKLLDGFPVEFCEGSHNPHRSRVLGDTGRNAPDKWKWGNDKRPTHVLLMLYCHTSEELQQERSKYETEAIANGLSVVVNDLEGIELRGRKEQFGFRDGIGQPKLRGNPLDHKKGEGAALAPGEFLLGYPDAYHTRKDKNDANIAFAPKTAYGFDFCKGGSFLVFRQLEQDVRKFWAYFDQAGEQAGTAMSAIEVASKAVGRWPNGEPLVIAKEKPSDPDKESNVDSFLYMAPSGPSGDSDVHGNRCPFGSHIRRTNPRDWLLGNNTAESLRLSALHRIIRRGRPYGPQLPEPGDSKDEQSIDSLIKEALSDKKDQKPQGLCFICFNANIGRQFEFVQQQWINNAQFGVLRADADPVMGVQQTEGEGLGGGNPAFTIQKEPLRQRFLGLTDFVRVVGSGYFFMPPISAVRYLEEI